MCGIAGMVSKRGVDEGALARMAAVLRHRGPDDEGSWMGDGVGLAHRRLAIVDLSPGGHQPMANEDGSAWIVYNGEVYNAREVGRELEGAGHIFRSTSDTEVIVHAWEQWGEECVTRFNGMWGLALWDVRRRRLWCSRDRFGVKPLYYHIAPSGTFLFGSEIKALLAAGLSAEVNESYAAHVLLTGRIDDGPETMFRGVWQLPPAHNLVLDDGRVELTRYWDFDGDAVRDSYAFATPEEGVRELLADAVRIRTLASDVQVGSCLSGGLDSSSIVALATRELDVPLATFSLEYGERGFDESGWARIVAEECGCDARYTRPSGEEFFGVMEKMAWYQDEPSAGPGLFSQWNVMRLAGPHVKVLLDGQGGDESLAGYRYHLEPYLRALAAQGLRGDAGAAARLIADLPKVASAWGMKALPAAARAFGGARARELYQAARGVTSSGVLSSDVVAESRKNPVPRPELPRMGDALNDQLYRDLVRDQIPSLLHYEDRNSMAFSIEARTPFLDYRFVEYLLGLPGTEKVRDGQAKWLFRRAMDGVTPKAVLERRDKMGYLTPTAQWFRNGLAAEVRAMLVSGNTRRHGVFDIDAISRKLDEHASGRADLSWHIYRWLSVEQWFRTFIDRRDASLGPVRSL